MTLSREESAKEIHKDLVARFGGTELEGKASDYFNALYFCEQLSSDLRRMRTELFGSNTIPVSDYMRGQSDE